MDWNKIKAEYIAGGTSYRRLAEKYNVSFNTLKTHAIEEEWYKLLQQANNNATTRMLESISKQKAKTDDTYFRAVDKLMQKAEELIENTPTWNAAMLKEMATTMKYLKECKGVKSEADLREQEARIAKLQKEAQEDENTTTEINVTFGSNNGSGKWAE